MKHWTLILLLLVSASLPRARGSTVGDVDYTCPIGGEKFKARVAFSGSQFGANLDHRPLGAIISPWPVPKCPKNGFVIFRDDFSKADLKTLESFVLSDRYQTAQKVESSYYLIALLQKELKEPAKTIAWTLMEAAWETENDGRYARYAQEALTEFDKVLAEPPGSISLEVRLNSSQMAGELERRLGRFDESKARLAKLQEEDGVKGTPLERVIKQELALIEIKDSKTHAYEHEK